MKHKSQRIMSIDEIERIYCKNLDIKKRFIYFGAWQPGEEIVAEDKSIEVNDWTAQNFIKGLYILEQSKIASITVMWFSYGGNWNAGMAMYDFIKTIKSPIIIKAYGRIRSMGTIILQAANKRLLSPNCEFMIHYGTGIGDGDSQHTKDLINASEEAKKCNRVMEDIYLKRIREKHPRYKRDKLINEIAHDKYMTPKEAIKLGLADGIIPIR